MVTARSFWLLAQAADNSAKLPPPTRAAVQMALLGILLLGMLLVVFVLLGGHWVRRLGSHRRGPAVPSDMILGKPSRGDQPKSLSRPPRGEPGDGETMIPDDTKC